MTSELTLNLPIFGAITERAYSSSLPQIYDQNQQRIYTLAFWMTDNELQAEELMKNCFHRAFATVAEPNAEVIDRALVTELRVTQPLGTITLKCASVTKTHSVRRSAKRVDLERAVVQLPATERMIYILHDAERYDETRIARLLGLREDEVRQGVHQARLRMRELLSR